MQAALDEFDARAKDQAEFFATTKLQAESLEVKEPIVSCSVLFFPVNLTPRLFQKGQVAARRKANFFAKKHKKESPQYKRIHERRETNRLGKPIGKHTK